MKHQMKRNDCPIHYWGIGTLIALAAVIPALAQEAADKPETSPVPAGETSSAREPLEKRFSQTLSKATFNGRWCLIEDGKLGAPKEETYTIRGVTKVGGGMWLIHARIQYGDHDLTVPVPVRVEWAGDTPVISITDLAIPGAGTYTARVVIYGDLYAGTWSGGRHHGTLNGVIARAGLEAK